MWRCCSCRCFINGTPCNLDIARLDHEIEQQDALENKQKTEIEALKTDPSYVERTARNKLNLSRPNEMIFRFEPAPQMPGPQR